MKDIRDLVYEEKTSLKNFGVYNMGSQGQMLYDNWILLRVNLKPGIKGFKNRIIRAFNDTFFVCTAVLTNPHSEHNLSYYTEKIELPSIVLPMIHFYLSKLKREYIEITRFLKNIDTEVRGHSDWLQNYNDILLLENSFAGYTEPSLFSRREYQPVFLSSIKWGMITERYKSERIKYIIKYLAKDVDEQKMMAKAIYNAIEDVEYESQNDYYVDDDGNVHHDNVEFPEAKQLCFDLMENDRELYRQNFYDEMSDSAEDSKVENNDEERIIPSSQNQLKKVEITNEVVINKGNKGNPKDSDWDNHLDTVFHPNLNVEAIAKAIEDIKSTKISGIPYWFVLYKVFIELHWIEPKKGKQKSFLIWAKFHFPERYNEKKTDFSDINPVFNNSETNEWNEHTTVTKRGEHYRKLADKAINTFVDTIEGKGWVDRSNYIKEGKKRINEVH